MKKNILKVVAVVFIFSITNCKVVQNNYCTTTEKMFNLHEGMYLNEVTIALGVDPKDVYQSIDRNVLYEESSLRGGPKRYKDESSLYVVFDAVTNKMLYYITDQGRSNGSKTIKSAIKLRILSAKK